jgi:hypothetical protein
MSAHGATGRFVLVVMAALFGTAGGLGALLGAATVTDRPPLFLVAGLAAFCATYLLGLLLATRGVARTRKRRALAVYFCRAPS